MSVNGKVLKPDAIISDRAPVYKGASNEDVYTIFKGLAGVRALPNTGNPMYQLIPKKYSISGQPGYLIKVPQIDGSTILLRNYSTSGPKSQARFTIEIQKPAGIKAKSLELKFQ